MNVRARVKINARGFSANPDKPVTITLDMALEGVPVDGFDLGQARELLVRTAILLTNPDTHEQLAQQIAATPKPDRPKRGNASGLKRVK